MSGGKIQWCPTADCGVPFEPHPFNPHFECPKCKKSYCLACKIPNHKGMNCEMYRAAERAKE